MHIDGLRASEVCRPCGSCRSSRFRVSTNDEVFETVEQAHKLVFGTGLVPSEFISGTRSRVLTGSLAGLIMLALSFGDGPGYFIPIIGSASAALGAASARCAFLLGRRFFRNHRWDRATRRRWSPWRTGPVDG